MNISIFGLGYVGCVGIGCLAKLGHKMIGVDVSKTKVDLINSGKPTIIEKDIDELIREGYTKGLITATDDYIQAINESEISFLCVGTPSGNDGHLNLEYIHNTAHQIGKALKDKRGFHIIVIRSTVFPGTNDTVSEIIEKESGKSIGNDFAVVSNPEFLREGTAVKDYLYPPLTVLGSQCNHAIDIMRELYSFSDAPVEVVPVEVAEMIKYVNNTFHALKVVFANEVGDICKMLNIDSHALMRIFCMDKQLNISPYYFKPGFAYGGSCLPKDLKGLQTLAKDLCLDTPVINSIEKSNNAHILQAIKLINNLKANKIGILGLSFKAGTDDMRNSPIITVINSLLESGHDIRIYDRNVSSSMLLGENKSSIEKNLPQMEQMLRNDLNDVTDWADALVISNKNEDFKITLESYAKPIIDLVRIKELETNNNYQGLCW